MTGLAQWAGTRIRSGREGTGFNSGCDRELFRIVFFEDFGRMLGMFGTHVGRFSGICPTVFGFVLDMFGNALGTFWDHLG